MAQHLQAVRDGEINRLIINIPPRCTKSYLVGVAYPAWTWWHDPAHQFLCVSHAEKLQKRDNQRVRRLIKSPWYLKGAEHLVNDGLIERAVLDGLALESDQSEKIKFELKGKGYRLAAGFSSGITGEGGDTIIIDDPHSAEGARSDAERENVLNKFDDELSTRLNDPKSGSIILVMQRLHEGDLTGHLLEAGGYEHLMLPMEFEPERKCYTSLPFEDPRTLPGELLSEERFDPEFVAQLKTTLGAYGASGQLQQRPSPEEGSYFKREWIHRYRMSDRPPLSTLRIYGASDYATKEGEGDFTEHGIIGVDPEERWWVLDWWRGQTESDQWIEAFIALVKKYRPQAWAEEQGQIKRAVGPFMLKRIIAEKAFVGRIPFVSDKDKPTRARSAQGWISTTGIMIPHGEEPGCEWADGLVTQMTMFPNAVLDDSVDVISLFGRMLLSMTKGTLPEPVKPPLDDRGLKSMNLDDLWKSERQYRQRTMDERII